MPRHEDFVRRGIRCKDLSPGSGRAEALGAPYLDCLREQRRFVLSQIIQQTRAQPDRPAASTDGVRVAADAEQTTSFSTCIMMAVYPHVGCPECGRVNYPNAWH